MSSGLPFRLMIPPNTSATAMISAPSCSRSSDALLPTLPKPCEVLRRRSPKQFDLRYLSNNGGRGMLDLAFRGNGIILHHPWTELAELRDPVPASHLSLDS